MAKRIGTLLVAILLSTVSQKLSATDFRMGGAIPVSSIVGSSGGKFKTGIGIEGIMDIQTDRESSYYVNIHSMGFSGSPFFLPNQNEIQVQSNVSTWGFSIGASFFPLRRKEGTTPVLSADYGFEFATETVKQTDLVVGSVQEYVNSIPFQSLGFSLGVEHQVNSHLSVHGRGRVQINLPFTAPSNYSVIYSNSQFNFLIAQFVVGAEYRFGK